MSDHISNGTNDEDISVNNGNSEQLTQHPKEDPILPKVPHQANFGRPRKHPYKPGKYKCEYCDVMCSKPSVLKKHLRAHTNERPYPCSICKRSFKTKSNLSKHMKSKSHSSRLPTNKEKAAMMLRALDGVDVEPPKTTAVSTSNIEYDGIEKTETPDNSPTTSCDDRSVVSEDNSTEESLKRSSIAGLDQEKTDGLENELSSCSGMLTINSQSGPITVEVEFKMETMKQLQLGLSNMVMKKYRSSSPANSLSIPRNDADVRAAESILHMANQRNLEVCSIPSDDRKSPGNVESKLVIPKEENKPIESTESPDTLANTRYQGPVPSKPQKVFPSTYNSRQVSRTKGANKLIPNEDQKKLKKCLVESLLKKMQKKSPSVLEISNPNSVLRGYGNNQVTESAADSSQNSPGSVGGSPKSQNKAFSGTSNVASFNPSVLISESKSRKFSQLGRQSLILQRAIPSNCPTTLPSNSKILLLSSFTDPKHNPQRMNSPISFTSLKFDPANENLSGATCQTPVPVATSTVTSRVASPMTHSIKEESTVQEKDEQATSDNELSIEDTEEQTYNHQTSNLTTQESDTCSSPRLYIVEENMGLVTNSEFTKNAESDEEIDVVNTDSDENDTTIKRLSDRSRGIATKKKRRGMKDCEQMECEAKKLKESEKAVTLHAPNINAKDLVQDCPLNLSANRQPIIPTHSQEAQTSGSVLEKIYRPMVTSSSTPESSISALTNTNPAHPLSIRERATLIDVTVPSNGHHIDYPMFEDKVRCEGCTQMIEPSKLNLHKSMHIYTDGKDQQSAGNNLSKHSSEPSIPKQPFNKPRTYRCVVCDIGFRVMGHLSKHHKSKTHLQGLVSSGLLSKALNAKIEESKAPIGEIIDQKTGNIIPGALSKYVSDWSHSSSDPDSGHVS